MIYEWKRKLMNLLILHSAYNSATPSGENQVVANEIRLLRTQGHVVFSPDLSASNPKKSWIKILFKNYVFRKIIPKWIYIYTSRKYLKKNQIQLVHCHNLFPLVDLSILDAALQMDIPIVFSIHNYRFLCINGLFYRDKQVCTLCIDSNKFGKKYKCYKNSRILSILAAKSQIQYLDYLRLASRILVLNNITKSILINKGIKSKNIILKRNFTEDRHSTEFYKDKSKKNLVWVGRIDDSKGLAHLIEAWNKSNLPRLGYQMNVVGDGPLRKKLEIMEVRNSSINFMGSKSRSELDAIYSESDFLLVSSRWLEGFPMVTVEAAMHNLRVMAPKFGSFLDLESQSWVSLVGNEVGEWVQAINQIPNYKPTNEPRNWYLENCTEEAVISKLVNLYEDSIYNFIVSQDEE
jgi:glycosyltransferase involved in cell wall biosynthesis